MRHFTLLLLSVFTVYQAKADILIPLDKYPTGEKRFNLQINGSHDTSTPWLSTTSFGVDEDGQMGNPENWTSEQIDEDNHSVSHRLIMNSISLRLSYRVWDNLSLWAGIGTTNFTHEETFRDDDDLSSTISEQHGTHLQRRARIPAQPSPTAFSCLPNPACAMPTAIT